VTIANINDLNDLLGDEWAAPVRGKREMDVSFQASEDQPAIIFHKVSQGVDTVSIRLRRTQVNAGQVDAQHLIDQHEAESDAANQHAILAAYLQQKLKLKSK